MTRASPLPARPPVVSVIMANHNGAAYLADAIASVRRQSLNELELIVSDDASIDDSARIIGEAIAGDPRIRLVRSAQNSGPAAARNKALALARGDWIAVIDGDDLMHADRLKRLVEAAERDGADIAADDLVEFDDGVSATARLLTGKWARAPFWVDIRDYLRLNVFYGRGPALGYLKPLFRRSSCFDPPARYDESLRIGEDFDLVLRLLQAGKRFRVYPSALYYYRRHPTSISHRLNEAVLIALKTANLRFLERVRGEHPSLVPLLDLRDRSIETALAYEKLLRALKGRNWGTALDIAAKKPSAAALLRLPIGVRLSRLLGLAPKGAVTTAIPERFSHQALDIELRETDQEARTTP
jgi:glycosyltransferase involved in cell wall biosynthesis